jgi:hypothetical protein
MLKMKKILAILLAVCFLVSITAASASAHDDKFVKKEKIVKKEKVVIKKTVVGKEKRFGDREEHRFRGENHRHKHFHPGHWEKHKVPHKKFINHRYVYVYVYESVFVNGYWAFN